MHGQFFCSFFITLLWKKKNASFLIYLCFFHRAVCFASGCLRFEREFFVFCFWNDFSTLARAKFTGHITSFLRDEFATLLEQRLLIIIAISRRHLRFIAQFHTAFVATNICFRLNFRFSVSWLHAAFERDFARNFNIMEWRQYKRVNAFANGWTTNLISFALCHHFDMPCIIRPNITFNLTECENAMDVGDGGRGGRHTLSRRWSVSGERVRERSQGFVSSFCHLLFVLKTKAWMLWPKIFLVFIALSVVSLPFIKKHQTALFYLPQPRTRTRTQTHTSHVQMLS